MITFVGTGSPGERFGLRAHETGHNTDTRKSKAGLRPLSHPVG
jgi:hypothetical protein